MQLLTDRYYNPLCIYSIRFEAISITLKEYIKLIPAGATSQDNNLKSYTNNSELVSRFACNTRVIVDASLNPPVFHGKSLLQKPRIPSSRKQTNIASSINHSNGNSIRWSISLSSSLVNTSVEIKNT